MKVSIIRIAAIALFTFQSSLFTANAQSAKSVLDKAAASVTVASGVKANFRMTTTTGNTSGTIAIKGKKFYATTPQAKIWFDGKTQWTYLKNNDEVNVSNPTEAQLQAINPYNFINLYKNGYTYTMNTAGTNYVIHLTSNSADRKIKELFITVNKKSYEPMQVKMLQGKKWTTFDITSIKKEKIADSQFRFNSKDFPKAEIIDLR
ncbi:MAG: cell envelope biogenesis protein LolA [Prevotella ruminicola]|jgi:outer membrane lipoprotein-sorting protein|uniref:Cell envelope biogenesis protein LolA n=1 Tax=Xylanibacter ruminicola TaxID=839 RepID=A0A928GGD7_XYLRU|nr:cell envelope biogenesis protein LolA [Xylanibacter ruminicola]MBR6853398.1 outer-membrane lipoprotein carrier protein LolA [Prevotella sp.]